MQERPELGACARPFLDKLPTRHEELINGDAGNSPAEWTLAVEAALQDRLQDRTQRQAVASGDEMEGGAQEWQTDSVMTGEQFGQLVGAKSCQTRPEGDVRHLGHLRLQADEMLDRIGHGHLSAAQEELPLEQGAIERALAENIAVCASCSTELLVH